ncbi:hypothetical protein RRF57_009466 [Xylaria bambusicola]|uniref:Uncharacterized protein n=1 Tax=Xylaria bambusicola TaxID=326684 RepID=A0AAN7UV10_9PEZI
MHWHWWQRRCPRLKSRASPPSTRNSDQEPARWQQHSPLVGSVQGQESSETDRRILLYTWECCQFSACTWGTGTLLCELGAVSRDAGPGLMERFSHEGLCRCLSFWESLDLVKVLRRENHVFGSEGTNEAHIIRILFRDRVSTRLIDFEQQHTFFAASSIIWRKSIFLPFDLPSRGIPSFWRDLRRKNIDRTHSGSTTINNTTMSAAIGDNSRQIWAASKRVSCHRLNRRPAKVCVMTR